MKTAIGIDLGGTHLRLALVSERGEILASKKSEIGACRKPEELSRLMASLASEIFQKTGQTTNLFGIGLAGIVSPAEGIVYSSPHFPEWNNVSWKKILSQQLGTAVVIDNDANMIALGEKWMGAAVSWDSFLMIALGTGIGGAIVIDSKIFHGDNGFAGEFGHMVLAPDGSPCGCGGRGCFETFASASGLRRMVEEATIDDEIPGTSELYEILKGKESDLTRRLAELAKKGNQAAREIYEKMGYYLGIGLASLIQVTGIQKIILGGGLAGAADLFLEEAKKEMIRRLYRKTGEGTEIRLSQLGDDAGVLGGALSALASCRT